MTELELYYNKFNEEKRLNSRHGKVEFYTTMKYLHKYLEKCNPNIPKSEICILDIGAGTGRYSIPLSEEGYDVTAIELVKHNLGRLKQKGSKVKAYQGNALKLSRFLEESFDVTLLFGPMYHLLEESEKIQALKEAKRVTKKGGFLLVAYILNEYSVITHAFKDRHIKESIKNGMLDETFHCTKTANPLYSMVRLEDIVHLNEATGMKRVEIVAADGPANYIRQFLNALDEEEFQLFMEYHLATCERPDLMGASAHVVDILQNI